MQFGRYLMLLSLIVICKNICSITGIYCCYQSLLYVQTYAVLLVSTVDINHCYTYKNLPYCWYLILLTIIVICTNICGIAGINCSNQSLLYVQNMQYCRYLLLISNIAICTKICRIALSIFVTKYFYM